MLASKVDATIRNYRCMVQKPRSFELYEKLTLRSLTALKMASKCSFTLCKLCFLDHFCLVMKHNSSFAVVSFAMGFPLRQDGKEVGFGACTDFLRILVLPNPENHVPAHIPRGNPTGMLGAFEWRLRKNAI
uniref:Uncharacterized protein n=1 Tax=Candidatus Kentrum sp. DK TaxID=2126562 RepID=A0A450SQZ7_9GAMM|nr:MAG: hypothetical protein BECKDK2373C_GA0170839_105333 [Candidatus Kentron sp. DK]VFJ63013.1 MAG: hypothetical protein BECKDK2373B_GA0170837_111810 [Candidatus Kentron sp. DK]